MTWIIDTTTGSSEEETLMDAVNKIGKSTVDDMNGEHRSTPTITSIMELTKDGEVYEPQESLDALNDGLEEICLGFQRDYEDGQDYRKETQPNSYR